MAAEAAGWIFLGTFRILKDLYGGPAFQQVIADTLPGTQQVFAEKIRFLGWYPYSCYADLLRAIQRQLEKKEGEICRRLGEASGRASLKKTFRVYKEIGDPERLILSSSKVWNKHFRGAGKLETVSALPENTRWRILGFDEMCAAHCLLHAGWLKGGLSEAASSVGMELVTDPVETACTRNGAPHHEFFCTWKYKT